MPRSVLRPPAVRVVASRAIDVLWCLVEGGDLPPSKPYLVALTTHVGGRGVNKCNGARGERVDRET